MFLDEVRLTVKAGDGGRGCVSFRREKYVPRGGPNGGDGGKGGDVVVRAGATFSTLAHLYGWHLVRAKRGEHGRGSNQSGAGGADAVIDVPIGTVIRDRDSGELLADLSRHHQVLCVTHLPQVAAFARHQLRVAKDARPGGAVADVEPLDAEGRVEEIARMLGGARITETTRRHAEEMLGRAGAPAAGTEKGRTARRAR